MNAQPYRQRSATVSRARRQREAQLSGGQHVAKLRLRSDVPHEPLSSTTAWTSSSITSSVDLVAFPRRGHVPPESASQPDSSHTTPGACAPSCTSRVVWMPWTVRPASPRRTACQAVRFPMRPAGARLKFIGWGDRHLADRHVLRSAAASHSDMALISQSARVAYPAPGLPRTHQVSSASHGRCHRGWPRTRAAASGGPHEPRW